MCKNCEKIMLYENIFADKDNSGCASNTDGCDAASGKSIYMHSLSPCFFWIPQNSVH